MNKTGAGLLIFIMLLGFLPLNAQEDHDKHDHYTKRNEVGAAIGMVFNLNEQETASGLHLHYARMFKGMMHNFGFSPGLEFLFGSHKHYTIHTLFVYRPAHGWWLAAGPGITYFDHENEFNISGHIETGYEFDAGDIHFGPVIEYSWAREDQHIMLGLHLGIPF